MPHNAMIGLLRNVFFSALQEDKILSASYEKWQISRRNFLKNSAITASGLALIPSLLKASSSLSGTQKNIVIIGAGMAGLNALYQLQKQGVKATLYEASSRAGGRMFTQKNVFGNGVTTDIGGEFVDSTHTEIIALMNELKLDFYDLRKDQLTPKNLFFEGRQLNEKDLVNALKPYVPQLVKDIKSLPEKIDYTTATSFAYLDNMSITEYLTSIGITGWLFNFIQVTLTREYGMEASEQSAINFLVMFNVPKDIQTPYELFGETHEVFKIKGGSQHLTDALYEKVKANVRLRHRLDSIRKGHSKKYALELNVDGVQKKVEADFVLLALPFTVLRNIPLEIDMPTQKRKCIDEMGYGNSCKFVMGMNSKPWRKKGMQGYTFTDIGFGCGWDSSQSQTEKQGSFTVFGGGTFGEQMRLSTKEQLVKEYLPALNKIYKGASVSFTNKTIQFCWASQPFTKGGYSCFKKGQWSTLAGWEAMPIDDIYFAGEHISLNFQGYMNGAAETAKLAVDAILEKIKNRHD